jgi:hypothetical protein
MLEGSRDSRPGLVTEDVWEEVSDDDTPAPVALLSVKEEATKNAYGHYPPPPSIPIPGSCARAFANFTTLGTLQRGHREYGEEEEYHAGQHHELLRQEVTRALLSARAHATRGCGSLSLALERRTTLRTTTKNYHHSFSSSSSDDIALP